MPALDLSDLDSLVEEAMEQWRVPGLTIAVLHGNEGLRHT
jgi:CubicO group peptidase (beta-lactamase class C family)